MLKNNSGFLLPTVLLFLELFSLLSLFGLNQALYGIQLIKFQQKRALATITVNKILNQLEQNDTNPSCLMQAPIDTTNLPLTWWQTHACYGALEEVQFYYLIENLGIDPCAIEKNSTHRVANYFRFTIYLILEKESLNKMLIKSTYAKSAFSNTPCKTIPHLGYFGRQIWVELGSA